MKLHVRQKRLIDLTPGADVKAKYYEVPYVVNIKRHNEVACAGAILSNLYVISPNLCVDEDKLLEYKIFSGSGDLLDGFPHIIAQKFDRIQGHEHLQEIALLIMDPRLGSISTVSRPIGLLQGPVLANRFGLISGWGYNVRPSYVINIIKNTYIYL